MLVFHCLSLYMKWFQHTLKSIVLATIDFCLQVVHLYVYKSDVTGQLYRVTCEIETCLEDIADLWQG